MRFVIGSIALLVIVACGTEDNNAPAETTEKLDSAGSAVTFADVQPIFQANCVGCHGDTDPKDGVRLNSYANVMAGGEHGPIVVAGKPEESELVEVIDGSHEPRMPFKMDPLSDEDIAKIADWIRAGAKE